MAALPEDPEERREFDRDVQVYGSPLACIASFLATYSFLAPPQGSYAKSMAIYANECAKADEEMKRLRADFSKSPGGAA